jgi:hypothetical protein
MFKSLLVALALVSAAPVLAEETQSLQNAFEETAVDAGWRIDFGPGGVGFGWSPGRRPHWNRPGRPPMMECQARNGRGIPFYGRAWNEDRAAHEALMNCRYSYDTYRPNSCRVVGCRYTY